jgi:putative ABC transport system substrate-binding protein
MKRREFITVLGGAVAWPLAASAQQAGKVWRIAYLAGVSRSAASGSYAAFVEGMRELGYIEGKDFVIEWRSVEGRYERFPEMAAELVRLKVDIFVTGVTAALPALQRATTTIPIVMAYSTDPVGNGLVRAWCIPAATSPGWRARPMTHRQSNWSC